MNSARIKKPQHKPEELKIPPMRRQFNNKLQPMINHFKSYVQEYNRGEWNILQCVAQFDNKLQPMINLSQPLSTI
jgi:hypothetical protein